MMRSIQPLSILPTHIFEKARSSPIQLPGSPQPFDLPSQSHKQSRKYRLRGCLALLLVCGLLALGALQFERLRELTWPAARPATLPLRYSKAKVASSRRRQASPVRTAERQPRWRDNLLEGVRYLTAGPWGGTSNQLHGVTNMLYLAAKTGRVAILPSLEPGWVSPEVFAKYSDFWDLERFTAITGIPTFEMDDIRANRTSDNPPEADRLGCWSTNEVTKGIYAWANTLQIHDINFDLWPLPPTVRKEPEFEGEMPFMPLQLFDLEKTERDDWLESLRGDRELVTLMLDDYDRKPPRVGSVEPTDQIMCYDNMFFMHSLSPSSPVYQPETFGDNRASWEVVGQHLHWNAHVNSVADEILEARLGSATQPFIAIHLRRNDFGKDRPLSIYVDGLERIHQEMLTPEFAEFAGPLPLDFNPRNLPVFAITDEVDPEFFRELDALGWHTYDHVIERTAERHGAWLPSIVDAALLSRGHGVVGTGGSTFSYQSMLRAQAWQGAATVFV